MHSIIWSGLIPGGRSVKRRRQSVFSLQWIRWIVIIARRRLHATWPSQGSLPTKIIANLFKVQSFAAIWSSLKRKACNFTKRGRMQSSSTTPRLPRRSTRSTRTRRNNIWGPLKRIIELQGNLEQQRGLQDIWHTLSAVEKQDTNRKDKSQDVGSPVWESPEWVILPTGLEADGEDQQVQWEIAKADCRHEQHWDLRTFRKFFLVLGNLHRSLRKMFETVAKSQRVQ